MSRVTYDPGIDRIQDPKEQIRFAAQNFDMLKEVLNNGLQFADNFDAKIINITFTSANADTRADHGLGRVPQGYIVFRRSASMVVYDGATAWSTSSIYLKSSATGTVTVMIF